jgi:hypothetical protein
MEQVLTKDLHPKYCLRDLIKAQKFSRHNGFYALGTYVLGTNLRGLHTLVLEQMREQKCLEVKCRRINCLVCAKQLRESKLVPV